MNKKNYLGIAKVAGYVVTAVMFFFFFASLSFAQTPAPTEPADKPAKIAECMVGTDQDKIFECCGKLKGNCTKARCRLEVYKTLKLAEDSDYSRDKLLLQTSACTGGASSKATSSKSQSINLGFGMVLVGVEEKSSADKKDALAPKKAEVEDDADDADDADDEEVAAKDKAPVHPLITAIEKCGKGSNFRVKAGSGKDRNSASFECLKTDPEVVKAEAEKAKYEAKKAKYETAGAKKKVPNLEVEESKAPNGIDVGVFGGGVSHGAIMGAMVKFQAGKNVAFLGFAGANLGDKPRKGLEVGGALEITAPITKTIRLGGGLIAMGTWGDLKAGNRAFDGGPEIILEATTGAMSFGLRGFIGAAQENKSDILLGGGGLGSLTINF